MSQVSSRGDYSHGVGGGHVGRNNVAFSIGGSMGFMDPDTIAFASGEIISYGREWTACKYHYPTGKIVPLSDPPTGANVGYAGGGHAAWWWGPDIHQPPEVKLLAGLWSTTGFRSFEAGLLGMSPDAAIAYKPSYQSNGPTMVRELDGSEWLLTPNHAYDLQLLGNRCALFNDSVNGFTVVGIPMPKLLGYPYFPHAAWLNGRWWMFYQTPAFGTVLHPFDDPLYRYVIRAPGVDVWLGFGVDDGGQFVIPCAPNEAEQPGQMLCERFSSLLQPLSVVEAPLAAPKIENVTYDPVFAAGKPWHSTFKCMETDFEVKKDEKDRYYLSAKNATDSDHTGVTRQLTVVGPSPEEPVPMPPKITNRFWFSPAIASADMLQLFDDLPQDVAYGMPIQNIIYEGANQGPNTSSALIAAEAFKKIKTAGLPLVVEMGSVKPGDCDCINAIHGLEWMLRVVREHGGDVACISTDEPLTADKDGCHQGTQKTAEAHAQFVKKALEYGVPVGWIEAWPHVSFDVQKDFFLQQIALGVPPAHWHLDIYWDNTTDAEAAKMIRDCWNLALQHGVDFGVYVNSTKDPIATDVEHRQNVLALIQRIKNLVPDVPQLVLAAWAFRQPNQQGLQDVPNNFGTDGLLASLEDLKKTFGADAPPAVATHIPYTMLIEVTSQQGLLAVKEIKPVDGDIVTLILPDWDEPSINPDTQKPYGPQHDAVFSMQSNGVDGFRPAGTAGPWERCRVDGTTATFLIDGVYWTRFYKLVGGL